MKAKKGNKVKIEYEGTLEDGTIFDSSKNHEKPLDFELGAGKVIPGFDKAIIGMDEGEEKTVNIPVEEAYGTINPELIKEVPKSQLPKGEVKEGMILGITLPTGQQIPAKVIKVTDENISLDLNHPLGGKALTFKIKLINIAKD